MSGGHGASRGSQQCRRRRRKGLAEKRRSSQRVGSGNVLFAFIKLALNKFHETACSRPQRIDAVGGGKSGRCYISRTRTEPTKPIFAGFGTIKRLQALLVLAPRRPGVYVVRGRTTGQKVNLTRTYPAALAPLRPRCPRTATTATAAASRGVVAGYRGHVANAHTLYLSVPSPGPPARRSPHTGGRYLQPPITVFSRSLRHRAPRKSTPINKVVALPLTASSCVMSAR